MPITPQAQDYSQWYLDIVKQAELGASQVFRVNEGISFNHSGQYTAVGRFDYSGP